MDAINNSILTWILLAPLAGAILIAILPDRGKLAAWVGLVTTLVTFGLTLHLPAHFIPGQPGFQFEINMPWIELNGSRVRLAHLGHFLSRGRGRAEHVARGAERAAGARGRAGKLERDQGAEEGLLLAVHGAADGDVRRVRRAGLDGVLRLLGADAGADGRADGHVWAQERAGRGDEVLPVHVHSVGAAAGGDSVAVCEDRDIQLCRRCG